MNENVTQPMIAEGLHENMSFEDYKLAPGVNNSLLSHGYKSWQHAAAYLRGDFDKSESKALKFGRIAHSLTLEPERYDTQYITVPEDAPKKPTKSQLNAKKPAPATIEAIKWWDDFKRQSGGREIVDNFLLDDCNAMAESMNYDRSCGPLLRMKGKREVSAFVTDPKTGLLLKARFDLLPDNVNYIADVKTARSTQPREWARDVAMMGYYRQAAFYLKVANLLGLKRSEFLFITSEKAIPFNPTPWQIGQQSIFKGNEENDRLLYEYKQCVETNRWPGYTPGDTQLFDVPQWCLDGKPYQEFIEYAIEE